MLLGLLCIAGGRCAIGLVPAAATPVAVAVLGAALVLTGLGAVTFNVMQVTIRQRLTPEAMLGRVNAVVRTLLWGVLPLGALLGGVLGARLAPQPAVLVTAALLVLPVALVLPLRTPRQGTT
jgi:hypothetical protein